MVFETFHSHTSLLHLPLPSVDLGRRSGTTSRYPVAGNRQQHSGGTIGTCLYLIHPVARAIAATASTTTHPRTHPVRRHRKASAMHLSPSHVCRLMSSDCLFAMLASRPPSTPSFFHPREGCPSIRKDNLRYIFVSHRGFQKQYPHMHRSTRYFAYCLGYIYTYLTSYWIVLFSSGILFYVFGFGAKVV